MSSPLLSRSPDLRRLVAEGYEVEVRGGLLLMHHIPYVDTSGQVRYGTLVSELDLAGDATIPPSNHVARFAGSQPCDEHGQPLARLISDCTTQALGEITVNFSFSRKPFDRGYTDYHEKMTTYAAILAAPARILDPKATAATFAPVPMADGESPFCYLDTASARAGIGEYARRLQLGSVAIVGLGGTGSYILDLVAKTPVGQIHLWDGDLLRTHNAFRAPGAASLEDLRAAPAKVAYFAQIYARMHRGIVPHAEYIDEANITALRTMDFVFAAVDRGDVRRLLAERLEEFDVGFIDVGLGIVDTGDNLTGLARTTVSTPGQREYVHRRGRIPFADGPADEAYARNIQVADLNMLNAALAVIRWKKEYGFYADTEREHFTAYEIDSNTLVNEDHS